MRYRPETVGGRWLRALAGLLAAGCLEARAASISGRVVDETGDSPALAVVFAFQADDWSELTSDSATDGSYSLIVPDGVDVLLFAIPSSGREVDGYAVHEYTAGLSLVRAPVGQVVRNIEVLRCHEFILEGRHSNGDLLLDSDLPQGSFLVGPDGEATDELLLTVDRGTPSTTIPSFCVPLGTARSLILRRELDGAGRLDLPLDRSGRLFQGASQTSEVIDLNQETATSQLARLDRLLTSLQGHAYHVPPELSARAADIGVATAAAAGLGGGERAAAFDAAASDAVVALEDVTLWRAEQDAETFRKGDLIVRVESSDRWPIAGVRVGYRQTSHDFMFGIFEPLAIAGTAAYERLQQAHLNTVTAGFYWNDIEPSQGDVRWDHIDHDIGVRDLAELGWRIKGHPLTWLLDLAMPGFLDGMDATALTSISVDHVREIVERYRDVVGVWDVNNEASGYGASGGLTREEMDAYLVAVFDAARAADPTATLILNNHFDRFGRDRQQERLEGREEIFTLSVRAFVERALGAGVDLDVVGQQMYNGGGITLWAQWGLGPVMGVPSHDLGFLGDTLEELAGFGRPIHITEQSVSSTWSEEVSDAGAGYWRRPWDEQTQADFVEAFYRLCFGTSAVEAVTWWNAVDSDSFIASGGLLRDDGTPKPALLRLEALIDGWTSSGEVMTDAAGEARLRGYGGDYELKVEVAGAEQVFSVHVSEQGIDTVTLVLDRPLTPAPRRPAGRVGP